MMLPTDSAEYEILERATMAVKGKEGMIIEFGTRLGGSAQRMIDIMQSGVIVCVDPYGNIPYYDGRSGKQVRYDYTNDMKNTAISSLYEHVKGMDINLIFINLEDVEFFKRYSDGVPVYNLTKRLLNEYRLAFLDAGHRVDDIALEVEFLAPRMSYGGIIIVDDIDFLEFGELHAVMSHHHFQIHERGTKKASFLKTLPQAPKKQE